MTNHCAKEELGSKGEIVWEKRPKPEWQKRLSLFDYTGFFREHWMWLTTYDQGELAFFEDFSVKEDR